MAGRRFELPARRKASCDRSGCNALFHHMLPIAANLLLLMFLDHARNARQSTLKAAILFDDCQTHILVLAYSKGSATGG